MKYDEAKLEKIREIYKKNNSNIKLKPEIIKLLEATNNEFKISVLSDKEILEQKIKVNSEKHDEQDEMINELFNQVYDILPSNNEKTKSDMIHALSVISKLIVSDAINVKKTLLSNDTRITTLESSSSSSSSSSSNNNFTNLVTMLNGLNVSGIADISNLIISNMTTLHDVSINGFAQLYGDLSVNGLTNMYDLSVSNMTTLHDVSINGFVETKQNITTKPYADMSAFTNFSEWIGIYDLSARPIMSQQPPSNSVCDLSFVSTYYSTIPEQCISGNLNNGKFKILTHDLSNIFKNTLLEVFFSANGTFSKVGSLELVMQNTTPYSIDSRSVYPEKSRTMCFGPQFFKTSELTDNNLLFRLDLSCGNNDNFIFSENPRLTLKIRNLL